MPIDEPGAGHTRRQFLLGSSTLAACAACPPVTALAAAAAGHDPLRRGFAAPPASAAPWTYWYWLSENIAKEGLTRDLEAMQAVGIGEALIGVVEKSAPPGHVKTLSEPWWDMVLHAAREGKRTGVDIGFFNSPGWSQSGGPWVKPGDAMRYIASAELRVRGPARLRRMPAAPGEGFQDVALLAFPAPAADMLAIDSAHARVSAQPALPDVQALLVPGAGAACVFDTGLFVGNPARVRPARGGTPVQAIDIVLDQPFTARSLTVTTLPQPLHAHATLHAENAAGELVPVKAFVIDRRNAMKTVGPMVYGPVAVAFPVVTARRFVLELRDIHGGKGSGLAGIAISAAARLESYVEKQLGKMHQTPAPAWNSYHWPRSAEPETAGYAIDPARIVDLASRGGADGSLDWEVPPGEWIVLRSGMLPTGAVNSPAPAAATGLEIDKMKASALEAHFDAYVGELLRRLSKENVGHALRRVVADSYEAGSQNWTDGFEHAFQRTYGYSPIPWLPVLTGRLVGSADRSERFLWDLRRLVADMIATNYVGTLQKVSTRHGLGLWLESFGHWGFPGEFLQYGAQVDRAAGEFWADGGRGGLEMAAAVNCGASYGKNIVSAEAFTAHVVWRNHPGSLKCLGDWAFASGINHFVLHVYIHQPREDTLPGMNAWFGTEFNRHNTWFPHSKPWIDYLRRTSFLLQQGRPATEFARFIGEDTPQMAGPQEPPLPAGFGTMLVNADVIENGLRVRAGRFVTAAGQDFGILVLPPLATMRPALLARIKALVEDGGVVVGDAPTRSPSLAGFPAADDEVRGLAAQLWHGPGGYTRIGRGHVFGSTRVADAVAVSRVPSSIEGGAPEHMLWTHRRLAPGDLYFLSNQQEDKELACELSFHAPQGVPELWDAVAGAVLPLPRFRRSGERVTLRIALPPAGSCVLVFRKPTGRAIAHGAQAHASALLPNAVTAPRSGAGAAQALDGPWQVRLLAAGQPPRVFDSLVSWPDHPDPAVRHYSGEALYSKTFAFEWGDRRRHRFVLDLGRIGVIAQVTLNGKDCGAVWTEPARLDVTDALRDGPNTLQVKVVSTWYNRLLAEQTQDRLPAVLGKVAIAVKPDLAPHRPQPSGLIGPVSLRAVERLT